MLIPRETLGLAAEFAVASELCRRGVYAQLTLGNRKRTDLLIHNALTDSFMRIEVKSKQKRDWPNCKGIYGANVALVFVDYMNKSDSERPDFFILTVDDWIKLVKEQIKLLSERHPCAFMNKQNVAVWPTQLTPGGRPYEGTGVVVQMVETHREKWEKIINAAVPATAEEPSA